MESTLSVYRICKTKFAKDLKGTGAFYSGGRWNSAGNFMLYTSSSVSLSMLEVLAHVSVNTWPNNMSLVTIKIPIKSITILENDKLPKGWNSLPNSELAQRTGDKWLSDCETLLLEVPSVINPKEKNYLINPDHALFIQIQIESIVPWEFDPRLNK